MFNSNPIEFNKSSLVSLKAEILRKQQEITTNKRQEKPIKLKSTKCKNKTVSKQQETVKDEEDEELLAKSRQMLESKAKLYDSLSKTASNPTEREKEITKRLLVQFDRKEQIENPNDSDLDYNSDEYDQAKNSDEEWVEYVDFLGRTRKCLRKDIEYMKQKDQALGDSAENRHEIDKKKFVQENNEKIDNVGNTGETLSEDNELLSSDMRREILRREWEKQEQELLNKKDIHYQDVLFNEARFHGAGYYAFSRDEEERIKQQENLNKLRQETAKQQQTTSEMKKLREKQLAARLKAARNRKRARMGLPPEPEDDADTEVQKQTEVNEVEKQIEAEKEAEEKRKQEERSKIVRPWDIGKEILKQHYEYSQEEWVKKQRDQRPKEFAPPAFFSNPKRVIEDDSSENKTLYFTTKKSRNYDNISSTITSNEDDSSFPGTTTLDPENLEESVLAGLKFLREQSEQQQ